MSDARLSAATPAAVGPDRAFLGLLLRAAVLGPVAAALATLFVVVQHDLERLLWDELPERLGLAEVPWWWVVGLLVTGALLTSLALRLPGGGGHSPLEGFALDVGPRMAVSAAAAGLASLSFGAVLGPEAPTLAIGSALGFMAASVGTRGSDAQIGPQRQLLMLAGGMAAFGAVLGNPIALAVFVLEAALVARRSAGTPITLAPVALALAFGYVVQVGLGAWAGLGEIVLSVPTLEPYDTVLAVDLVVSVVLAAVVATVVHLAFRGGRRYAAFAAGRSPVAALVLAAVLVAALALAAREIAGAPLELVLFSGQQAIPELLTITSVGLLVVVVVAKGLAYSLCLGSGFRGGPVFPAIALGVAMGVLASLLVAPASSTGLVAAAVAAATAAAIRLPFSSALLATLLTASAGLAVTTPALLGAVVGLLTVIALDRRLGPRISGPPVAAGG